MKNFKSFAFAACVLAPSLLLAACNTVDGFVDDIRYNDWFANTGKKTSSASENLLSDGCPKASIVPELGTYPNFIDDKKPTTSTLVSAAKIETIQSKCQFASQSVTVDIKLAFDGILGPAGKNNQSASYPFFVAVTSPGGAILAKEVFAANMNYQTGPSQTYVESMRQIIPIPSKVAGEQYKILAGFQLTDDQLRYNRAVIAAEEAARIEREKVRKAEIEAAKKGAKQADNPDVIIVPDTMTPADAAPNAANEPVNIAPLKN